MRSHRRLRVEGTRCRRWLRRRNMSRPDRSSPSGPVFRRIGDDMPHYVDRILNGAKPVDLPVESALALRVGRQPEDSQALGLRLLPPRSSVLARRPQSQRVRAEIMCDFYHRNRRSALDALCVDSHPPAAARCRWTRTAAWRFLVVVWSPLAKRAKHARVVARHAAPGNCRAEEFETRSSSSALIIGPVLVGDRSSSCTCRMAREQLGGSDQRAATRPFRASFRAVECRDGQDGRTGRPCEINALVNPGGEAEPSPSRRQAWLKSNAEDSYRIRRLGSAVRRC